MSCSAVPRAFSIGTFPHGLVVTMPSRSATRAGLLRGPITIFMASAWSIAVWAACTCGYGDGMFTLTSISVDGDLSDWAPVLADVDNNVCDGPVGGTSDRDAPVQSTGRDLTHFAYTWDQNNIYLFTERFGSASNQQSFVYYADTDNDKLMETGEPVIGVTWRGSNRRVNVYIFNYVAQAVGGDPMVDGNGYGDGYTLPGSFANVPSTGNPTRSGPWGSADGLKKEFFVTWSEIGVTPGSAFTFHVASSNASLGANSFAKQVDDNLSGCGGGLGSTAEHSLTFTPDLSLDGIAGQPVVGVHVLKNTGNAGDFYDFSSTGSGDFTAAASYYEDVDGSNSLTAADSLLTDSDGDGDPDTRTLAPDESVTILIAYDIPGGASPGDTATIETAAAADAQPLAIAIVTDTITLLPRPELSVTKTLSVIRDPVNVTTDPKAIPGSEVRYSIVVSNQGAGTVDDDTIVVSDMLPPNTCAVVLDAVGPGSGPVEFVDGIPSSDLSYSFVSLASTTDDLAFSDDGGLTYDYVPVANASGCDPVISNMQIKPKGTFAANTGAGSPSAEFSFRIIVQ